MTSEPENIWGSAATFAVVAAVMGSIFLIKGPLESQRPQNQLERVWREQSFDSVPARLWQDPLYAIQAHERHLNGTVSTPSEPRPSPNSKILLAKLRNAECERRLQLLVMMSGGPYSEDHEDRRRQRHAVVSALTDHDYAPDNAGRIQVAQIKHSFVDNGKASNDSPDKSKHQPPPLLAFETYTLGLEAENEIGTYQWKSILVMWLNSEDFDTDLLGKIANLMRLLNKNESCEPNDQVAVFLGPTSSGSLSKMLTDQHEASQQSNASNSHSKTNGKDERLGQLRVLSPRATLPLGWLFARSSDSNDESRRSSENPSEANEAVRRELGVKSFSSVVAADDRVQRAILNELKSRGLFSKGLPLIAIVSEQDSPYGRLLDDILEDVIRDFAPRAYKQRDIEEIVHEYGYLRGVDGELIGTTDQTTNGTHQQSSDGGASNPRIESSLMPTAHVEHSFGASQLDYIRRLADHIAYDMSHNIGNEENVVRPVVIGILGSNVYDKLLILQALRERLPRATFFTTDLDARLTDPDVYAWSRNLIIGSPYGLDVCGLKGAGFRGSYQTALYRAVTLALKRQYYENPPPPRLFEIGRTGPIDIGKEQDGDCETYADGTVHSQISHIRSKSTLPRYIGSVLFVLAPLLVLTLFSFAKSKVLHDDRRELRHKAHSKVSKIGACLLVVLALAALLWKVGGYEPWPFFEGVNSQPTIILYLITVIYAWALILIMLANIDQTARDIHGEFGLPLAAPTSKSILKILWATLQGNRDDRVLSTWTWRREISGIFHVHKSVRGCWRKYLMYHQFGWQIIRISFPVIFISAIVFGYISQKFVVPGPLLTRDVYSLLDFAHWLAISSLIFTVFFCSDTLSVGRLFLREISRHRLVNWPKPEKPNDNVSRLKLTMDLVVRYTESVRPVAVRPFILIFLLILARSTVLEGWVWTPEVALFYTGLSFLVLFQAVRFQLEAVRARDSVLSSLDGLRRRNWRKPNVLSRIEATIGTINGMNRGAFVPWTRQPILQSLLLPVGAYGVVILLDTIF